MLNVKELDPQNTGRPNIHILSFDESKVRLDPENGVVTKTTTQNEYDKLLSAAEYANTHDIGFVAPGIGRIAVRVPQVLEVNTRNGDAGLEISMEYCRGSNLETSLRAARSPKDRLQYEELIKATIDGFVAQGFGWADIAPRNMVLDIGSKKLSVFDFERGFVPDLHDKSAWERILHGYTLEELSCLVGATRANFILSDHIRENKDRNQLVSLVSTRKKGILDKIYDRSEYSLAQARTAEKIMALFASRPDDSKDIPMDRIETMTRGNGVQWYVDQALGNVKVERTLSPTGNNTVVSVLHDEVISHTLEFPPITVDVPSKEGYYSPAKTAADFAYILSKQYSSTGFKGMRGIELGCGDHGVLAHVLKELGCEVTVGADIDPKAIDSVSKYGDSGIEWINTDLMDGLEEYDVIVFNPPQMPMSDEMRTDLVDWHDSPGPFGYELIVDFLQESEKHLSSDGIIVMMVFDFLLTDGRIEDTCKELGYETTTIGKTRKDLRLGGRTSEALTYIQHIFPGTEVLTDDNSTRYISGSFIEFKKRL
jgi:hypothetical protein